MNTREQMLRQFRLLTDWYVSVLEGITEEQGSQVLSEHTNSLEWIAGHLLIMRARNTVRLGQPVESYPYLDLFVDPTLPPPQFIPFDRSKKYPGLMELVQDWTQYSDRFIETLEAADDWILQTEIPLQGPTGGTTVEDLFTSMVLHEAFHIGQMSIIRKALGYQGMYWFRRRENQERSGILNEA